MNYRHAYHAGNFADVLKHATLALVIEHMKLKPSPFRVVDTHAGTGVYDLAGDEAGKTGEWRDGIARLRAAKRPAEIDALLRPYLACVEGLNATGELARYPGSPLLARRLMRREDRLVANELHPEDGETLKALFAHDAQVKVTALDGWTALKAFLPPRERRGIVLIDPPFEQPGEFERMAGGVVEALRRFATGVLLMWYPIKSAGAVDTYRQMLAVQCARPALDVELILRPTSGSGPLTGTGLTVINPPHTLPASLSLLLPFLVCTLGEQGTSQWRIRQLVDEATARERISKDI